MAIWRSVKGFLSKGLTMSCDMTHAIELRPVESELRAALNTPATKSPGMPGKDPKVRIIRIDGS